MLASNPWLGESGCAHGDPFLAMADTNVQIEESMWCVVLCCRLARKNAWASEVTLSDAASGRRRQGGVTLTVCMGHTRSQAIDGPSSSSASN